MGYHKYDGPMYFCPYCGGRGSTKWFITHNHGSDEKCPAVKGEEDGKDEDKTEETEAPF